MGRILHQVVDQPVMEFPGASVVNAVVMVMAILLLSNSAVSLGKLLRLGMGLSASGVFMQLGVLKPTGTPNCTEGRLQQICNMYISGISYMQTCMQYVYMYAIYIVLACIS